MLFYLTDSLIINNLDLRFPNIKRAITRIALSVFEGNHLLLGDPAVIEYYCDIFQERGDADVFLILNSLKQQMCFSAVPSFITRYIEIVIGNPMYRRDGNKDVYQLSYECFLNMVNVAPSNLVGEDLNDIKMYQYILAWFKNYNHYNMYCFFKNVQGGGKRTADVIKEQNQSNQFCIAIVDTDKKYRDQKIASDSTVKKCKTIQQTEKYQLVILNVQEIENLIPKEFICTKCSESHICSVNTTFYFNLYGHEESKDILPYFDLKKGIVCDNLLKTDVKYQEYAKKCCSFSPDILGELTLEEKLSTLKDQDVLYPGVCKNLLKHILKMYNEDDFKSVIGSDCDDCEAPRLMDFQEVEWRRIGQALLNFGCARNKESLS